ncbi:MAG: hypothetical protein HZA31_11270 [Opitutae bacterium]|nr:hypothetical protein [Opitutae bacterium]
MTAKRLGILTVYALGIACLLSLATGLVFTTYMLYDDEGYVVWTLRQFTAHGHLYDQVYSQYGPLFYLGYGLLAKIFALEWTNTLGRLITVHHWWLTSLLCGFWVWRETRSRAATAIAASATLTHLWQMTSEPMHPGGTTTLLLALAVAAGTESLRRERADHFALLAGLAGAALTLIKINVGIFFLLALASWGWWRFRAHTRMPERWVITVAFAALPWVLMRPFLGEHWAREFATLASAAIAGIVLVSAERETETADNWSNLGRCIGAATGLTAIVLFAAFATGSSWRALWEGVVAGPLQHPNKYHHAIPSLPGAVIWSLGLLALAAGGTKRRWIRTTLLASQAGALGVYFIGLVADPIIFNLRTAMSYFVPTAWVFALSFSPDNAPAERRRLWVAAILAWQYLHAFPIAGSQMGWGTFLWAPLAAISLNDWHRRFQELWGMRGRWIAAGVLTAGLISVGHANFNFASTLWQRRDSDPLELPGSAGMMLPASSSSALRVLTLNARVHGDTLFSLPGTFSFNIWSELPTPTLANTTHWFSLLNVTQQTAIRDRLSQDKRAVMIVQPGLIQFLHDKNIPVNGLLFDWVGLNFTPAFALENYEFWVHRDRPIAPLSTATLFVSSDTAAPWPTRIRATVLLPPTARVTRVELRELRAADSPLWSAADLDSARIELARLNSSGQADGPPRATGWPIVGPGIFQLDFYLKQSAHEWPITRLWLGFFDTDGHRVAEARFTVPFHSIPGIAQLAPTRNQQ